MHAGCSTRRIGEFDLGHRRFGRVVSPGDGNPQRGRGFRHLNRETEAGRLKDTPCRARVRLAVIFRPAASCDRVRHLGRVAKFVLCGFLSLVRRSGVLRWHQIPGQIPTPWALPQEFAVEVMIVRTRG